jgi:hypothetical protein
VPGGTDSAHAECLNASVTLTNSATQQPLPVWQTILGSSVDDYNGSVIMENATQSTVLSVSQYLTATASQGTTVYYYLSGGDGSPVLLNGDSAFTYQAPTSNANVMPIVVGHPLDASVTDTYVLRCRTFVSCHFIVWHRKKVEVFYGCINFSVVRR